jgi:hypothetical protein
MLFLKLMEIYRMDTTRLIVSSAVCAVFQFFAARAILKGIKEADRPGSDYAFYE